MSLKDRISQVLNYSKLSPAEFADQIEVQRSSLSHIASGRNKPSLDFLIKVKEVYPELSWDWLINGDGDMLIKKDSDTNEEIITKPTPLPDLFSIINDDDFGYPTEKDDHILGSALPQESSIPAHESVENVIRDSQPLEKNKIVQEETLNKSEIVSENKTHLQRKINKIVIFYDDGKFESFDPS